jgi:hypothetical protein
MRTVKIIGLVVAIVGLLTAFVALLTESIRFARELPHQPSISVSTEPVTFPSNTGEISNNPPVTYFNEWVNVDSQTDNIKRVSIESKDGGTYINMFGACSPTDCNLREYSPAPVVNYNYDSETGILHIEWIFDFQTMTQELTLTPDGQLKVTTHEHFTDNSGRLDYDSVNYFTRQ